MAELSDGNVRLDARNNAYTATGHNTRMFSLSTSAGDSWSAMDFDDALSLDPTCQGASPGR